MQESFPFNVYSGLLTKEHRKRIGSALWEFLWCIDKTTKEVPDEEGHMIGLVFGGKPIKLSEISEELGGDRSTILRNIDKLEAQGYISVIRAPYGLIIKVRNSKKWCVVKTQRQPNECINSVAKMQQPLQKRNERCENANSNKDLAFDLTNDFVVVVDDAQAREEISSALHQTSAASECEGIPSSRHGTVPAATPDPDTDSGREKISQEEYRKHVSDKYIQRRAKGFDLSPNDEFVLNDIISARIPLQTVIKGIDIAFDSFSPKHPRDEIRSLNYCVPHIFDLHTKNEAKASTGSDMLPYQEKPRQDSAKAFPIRGRGRESPQRRKPIPTFQGNHSNRMSREKYRELLDKVAKFDNREPLTDEEFERSWEEVQKSWGESQKRGETG